MKEKIVICFLSAFLFSCSTTDNYIADNNFHIWMHSVSFNVTKKQGYRHIPFRTIKQVEEFDRLIYKAYKKQISKDQFIKLAEKMHPGYSTSIIFIASQLTE